mgnify:CR=1 FL=1
MLFQLKRFIFTLSLLPSLGFAGQVVIPDYDTARDTFFWDKLYTSKGESLYCSISFDNGGYFADHMKNRKRMTLEHVIPADWMAEHFKCDNRNTCVVTAYKHAEADLHNLWPAHGSINSSRSDVIYKELDDSKNYSSNKFSGFCSDFERRYVKGGLSAAVEPQDSSKGEIARSLLYMRDSYGFGLKGMDEMLLGWDRGDPVSEFERVRNELIFKLQGTRNHWIR